MRVRRMIYIFEGSYWRALCLSQHTTIIRLLRYIVIEKSYASISAALVRTCDQVGTREKGVERGVNTYVRDTPLGAESLLNVILDQCASSKWSGEEPCDPHLARTIANGDATQIKCSEVIIFTST